MRVPFTKMQGAGNDFVVLDETRRSLGLTTEDYRLLADRHFGVGADQILTVRPGREPDVDFEYVIHNADGGEVEQCGNGARCFVRFVRDKGLTTKDVIRVRTLGGVIEPRLRSDGRVTVDMGLPVFEHSRVPFVSEGLQPESAGQWHLWPLPVDEYEPGALARVAVLSMGNPHAVMLVDDVGTAAVHTLGPAIERHARFPRRVNAGFLQVVARDRVRLRVYERGAGETLACGSGACAAVVAGIRLGLLDSEVTVHTRGGDLTISWDRAVGHDAAPVMMTGPAVTVFESEIDLPDRP